MFKKICAVFAACAVLLCLITGCSKENMRGQNGGVTSQSEGETAQTPEDTPSADKFTVTFKDYDGKVLKTEKVKKGESAVPPASPSREGYLFVKWGTAYDNVKTDIVTVAVYEEITEPTIIVGNAEVSSEKEISVPVSVLNNPGLLCLMLSVEYDESALKLIKTESGSAMSEYMFTSPKNMKSGCNAAWYANDVPEKPTDGEVLILHFEILKGAKSGTYPIGVSCLDGAYDEDYNSVAFDTVNGSIIIK